MRASHRILGEIRDLRGDIRAQNERAEALMSDMREELAQSRAEHQENIAAYRSEIQLNRELIRRNEIAVQQGGAVLAELVEEVRAQTKAIFEVLDRLNGGTAAA